MQQQNYCVLFNLDVSGSMIGNKWYSVCQAVARFTNFLGQNDLISAMVFNDQPILLALNIEQQKKKCPCCEIM